MKLPIRFNCQNIGYKDGMLLTKWKWGSIISEIFIAYNVTKRYRTLYIGLDRLREELPEFIENQHMKVVKLVSRTPRLSSPASKQTWYSFLLEAESTPRP